MTTFDLEQELKNRIPSFQRENEDFDQFLEAVGKYLDHIKQEIDNLKYRSDYNSGSIAQVVSSLEQDNIEFTFTTENDAVARMVLRDITEIVRVKGTQKTIEWIFKAIDLNVKIDYAWILNPDTFVIPPQTEIVPSTFIYGRPSVYEDGVYFNGEGSDGTVYTKIPIVGEPYSQTVDATTTNVLKTPYIYLNVPLGEFNRFSTENELESPKDFETIILRNFNEIRPINVVLVIVIIPEGLSDMIPYTVVDQTIQVDSQYFVDSNDPRWLAGITLDPTHYGEYFTTPLDPAIGSDLHTYLPSREEYVSIPYNTFTRQFTSQTPLNEQFQVRDHALVNFDVKTVQGTYQLRHSDSPRTTVFDGSGIWTNFASINPSNAGYKSNVHKFGSVSVGTIPYSAGRFTEQGGIPYNSQTEIPENEWYKTTSFEDMFVGKRAIQIVKSSDWIGQIDMNVEFFSLMHRLLFSYQLKTAFTRTSSGTQINENNLIETRLDNEPRSLYRHDGIRQGYFFEGASSQLLQKTQQLEDTTKWTRTRTLVSNTTIPFHNTYFRQIKRTLSGSNDNLARISQTVTGMKSATRYALSFFVAQTITSGNAENHSILLEQGTRSEVISFRSSSKAFSSNAIGSTFSNKQYVYQQITENQYRLTIMFDSAGSDDLSVGLLADYHNVSLNQFSIFSGIQLEEDVVSSYIPRDTALASRNSERAAINFLPLTLSNGGTIVIDCTTINHKSGTILEVTDTSGKSIRLRIQDQLLHIGSQPVHTIMIKENLFHTGMYIAFKPIGTDLQYWIENDNGERNVGTIANAGLSGQIGLKIGTNVQETDPFYGVIRNVYVSTDDFNSSINRVYESILLQYRSIRN